MVRIDSSKIFIKDCELHVTIEIRKDIFENCTNMENIICLLNSSLFLLVNAFGRITDSTYSSLADNTVLSSDTTLYCVTENKDTPQVTWSYLNLDGIRTNLTSTTGTSTGVSIIQVSTTQPGYYTCEVSQNGGMNTVTYTAVMRDTDINTGMQFVFRH